MDVGELGRQRLIGAIEDAEHQLEESLNELAAGEAEIDKDIEGDREEIAHILESVPQLQVQNLLNINFTLIAALMSYEIVAGTGSLGGGRG